MIPRYDIVVPSIGRPSLTALLQSLDDCGAQPERIVVVDDSDPPAVEESDIPEGLRPGTRIIRSGGGGPASARNIGWRACSSEWVVFLDDDVVVGDGWADDLEADMLAADPIVAAIQGRIVVPLPVDRKPTDWERSVAGLASAQWITADMACRRWSLEMVGGFDERFPRAYREDSDLALRLMRAGLSLERGRRVTTHPVPPARWSVSIGKQAGNADDALMTALHGPGWRSEAGVAPGLRRSHILTTVAAVWAGVGRRRWRFAGVAMALWLGLTTLFAFERIRRGPGSPREVATMAVTSVAIPPVATGWWVLGWLGVVRRLRRSSGPRASAPGGPIDTVCIDRDDTLIRDIPYNGDPDLVEVMPGAEHAIRRLRDAGVSLAVVTNQSGVGRGALTSRQVNAVNRRVDELLGRFDAWIVCTHAPDEGCGCRKPRPGMVQEAAERLGTAPARCAVIGDIGADVEAARAAGAFPILVPTPRTLPAEVHAAPAIAADLAAACDLLERHLGRPRR